MGRGRGRASQYTLCEYVTVVTCLLSCSTRGSKGIQGRVLLTDVFTERIADNEDR